MRPVRTPHNPIRVGSNQCLGGCDVLIVGCFLRCTISAANFDINLAGANQLGKVCKTRLFRPECGLSAAKMVEDHGNGRSLDQVLYPGDYCQVGVHLDMPATTFHPVDGGLKALTPDAGVVAAASREIEPDAADAGAAHRIEIALARPVVDNSYAAGVIATRFHAKKGGGIVSPIYARRHNHHALDLQRSMQR